MTSKQEIELLKARIAALEISLAARPQVVYVPQYYQQWPYYVSPWYTTTVTSGNINCSGTGTDTNMMAG